MASEDRRCESVCAAFACSTILLPLQWHPRACLGDFLGAWGHGVASSSWRDRIAKLHISYLWHCVAYTCNIYYRVFSEGLPQQRMIGTQICTQYYVYVNSYTYIYIYTSICVRLLGYFQSIPTFPPFSAVDWGKQLGFTCGMWQIPQGSSRDWNRLTTSWHPEVLPPSNPEIWM
jgi:hypothetical protein